MIRVEEAPVSSMLSFEVFVRPAILKIFGQKDDRKEVDAVLINGFVQ